MKNNRFCVIILWIVQLLLEMLEAPEPSLDCAIALRYNYSTNMVKGCDGNTIGRHQQYPAS